MPAPPPNRVRWKRLNDRGLVAHETRDLLNTALLAFEALKRGDRRHQRQHGRVLARSLTSLRDLVDNTLTDIRITATSQRREFTPLASSSATLR